jgi:cytochrome P450
VPAHVRRVIEELRIKGPEVNVEKLSNSITAAVITHAAFGTDDPDTIREMTQHVDNAFTAASDPLRYVGFDAFLLKKNRILSDIHRSIGKYVTKLRSQWKFNNEARKNLMDYMLLNPAVFTDQVLVDNALTFAFGGTDTTSQVLSWALYELASNPVAQARLFEELEGCIALDVSCSVIDVKNCEYLNDVIRETMRSHPGVSELQRYAPFDDVLPGTRTFIPAGSQVVVPCAALAENTEIYGESAQLWIPERWADQSLRQLNDESTIMLPFGAGVRGCPGKDFAWNELLISIAMLMRNFEWSVKPGETAPYNKSNFISRMDHSPILVARARRV